jgi:large subunit ribosomal protein L18
MNRIIKKRLARIRRHERVGGKVRGSSERPRLAVFRSDNHIYAQVIDDLAGKTLVAASSLSPEFKAELAYGGNIAAAKVVGKLVAVKAIAAGISKVAYDRGGFHYHGRVKALAEAAREAGLEF